MITKNKRGSSRIDFRPTSVCFSQNLFLLSPLTLLKWNNLSSSFCEMATPLETTPQIKLNNICGKLMMLLISINHAFHLRLSKLCKNKSTHITHLSITCCYHLYTGYCHHIIQQSCICWLVEDSAVRRLMASPDVSALKINNTFSQAKEQSSIITTGFSHNDLFLFVRMCLLDLCDIWLIYVTKWEKHV